MNLSPHFTVAEFTTSQAAARKGLDNTPSGEILSRLRITAANMERIRSTLGEPVAINSAYRSAEVNAAIGGASNSAHVQGWAVDFICPGFGSPLQVAEAVAACGIKFDQLIHEFGSWCHVSFDPRMRGQALTIDRTGTRLGLHS